VLGLCLPPFAGKILILGWLVQAKGESGWLFCNYKRRKTDFSTMVGNIYTLFIN